MHDAFGAALDFTFDEQQPRPHHLLPGFVGHEGPDDDVFYPGFVAKRVVVLYTCKNK
jgi:hypothetical protein